MGRRLKWGTEEDKQTELLQWGASKCGSWAPRNPGRKQVEADGDLAVGEILHYSEAKQKKIIHIVTKNPHIQICQVSLLWAGIGSIPCGSIGSFLLLEAGIGCSMGLQSI